MLYCEALDWIERTGLKGSVYGLERVRALLALFHDPHKKLKCVHIAGTNGKGSVSAMLVSVLKSAGYRVGAFNSPAVLRYNEIITINGEPIDDDSIARLYTRIRDVMETENAKGSRLGEVVLEATAFEIETAAAFLYFFESGCDICVVETGCGGRDDSTNVFEENEVAVITPIALDHCRLLGQSLSDIASVKSGIIRKRAVTCPQVPEVIRVLSRPQVCVGKGQPPAECELTVCDTPEIIQSGSEGQHIRYKTKDYRLALTGNYQAINAAIVVETAEILRRLGWSVPQTAVEEGLKNAKWPFRFQIITSLKEAEKYGLRLPKGKSVVFDGAHNPHGARALAESLKQYFPDVPVHFVTGVLADKDADGIVTELSSVSRAFTTVESRSQRALEAGRLKQIIEKHNCRVRIAEDAAEAINNALEGDCGVAVLCGSLTLFKR